MKKFSELADDPQSGVSWIKPIHYFKTTAERDNFLISLPTEIKQFTLPDTTSVNSEYPFCAAIEIPLANPIIYRPYLFDKFKSLNGTIVFRSIASLQELTDKQFDAIINCAGHKSATLANDKNCYPVKGQNLSAPWQASFTTANSFGVPALGVYTIFRQPHDCVMGSTWHENQFDLEPSEADQTAVLTKLTPFFPVIRELNNLKKIVGVRCARTPDVRIEKTFLPSGDTPIFHCYGHSGSGYSGSWGSAEKILELVNAHFCSRYSVSNSFVA